MTSPAIGSPTTGGASPGGAKSPGERVRDEAARETRGIKEEAAEVAEGVRQQAGAVAEKARQQASDVGHRVAQQAGQARDQLREQGEQVFAAQKGRVAEQIDDCSAALRRAASKFEEEDDLTLYRYADMAADRLDQAARYVRSSDIGRLKEDAEEFTRRRPETVFGGMFLAGLAVARFLKSSGARQRERDGHQEWAGPLAVRPPGSEATSGVPVTASTPGVGTRSTPGVRPTPLG